MSEPLKPEPYHYLMCGLDNVYLLNGYSIEQTEYGRAVHIHDADELHEAIGLQLVTRRKLLSGHEIRFLRRQLDLTQAGLGDLMGQSSQQVARWEKGKNGISGPADRLLRLIFLFHHMSDSEQEEFMGLLERLHEMDEPAVKPSVTFQSTEDGWRQAA